jgi:hypothetical protein
MNQGERYLRNTVLALCAAVALFFVVNRLFAATVHSGAPQWLGNATSLGLASWARAGSNARYLQDLALRDFTRLHLHGRFTVEIVGAPQYQLSFTTAYGRALPLAVRQEGDQLWLTGFTRSDIATTAVLRIETPALVQVDARKLTGLTLRGLQSPELAVDLNEVPVARLLDNKVARWTLHSDASADVQVDKATLAAGKVLTSGDVAIRYGE